jgi:hypothetical protein
METPNGELFDGMSGRAVYPGMQTARAGMTLDDWETWQHKQQTCGGLGGHLVLDEIQRKRGVEHYLGVTDVKVLCAANIFADLWRKLKIKPHQKLGLVKSVVNKNGTNSMPAVMQDETGFKHEEITLDADTVLREDIVFVRLSS